MSKSDRPGWRYEYPEGAGDPECRTSGHLLPRRGSEPRKSFLGWLRGYDRCRRCGIKRIYH